MTLSVQATFAATLVDEWARCGVTDAVVCPGSRSTPMAIALYRSSIRVRVVLDERVGSFVALGLARSTGRAVPVVTTSGTAAVELHPAVVEAHHGGVPLLAVTADRPPELHRVGAPQACEQQGLYGSALRWAHDPGVARKGARSTWRSLAARSVAESLAGPMGPGPVHLNLPFVEPLDGEPGELLAGRGSGAPWHRVEPPKMSPPPRVVEDLAGLAGRRGVVMAGYQPGCDRLTYAAAVSELAASLGWPLLADPTSGAREAATPTVIAAADTLLRSPDFAEKAAPEVIVRFGRPWASRVVSEWVAGTEAQHVLVDPFWGWADPGRTAASVVRCDPAALCTALVEAVAGNGETDAEWASLWRGCEAVAQEVIEEILAEEGRMSEPWIARELVRRLPPGSALVTSSSLPVREVEWFSTPRSDHPVVIANRGVNGIDGVVSTAVGVAASGVYERTVALVGDLAFLHDSGALMALPPDCPLTVVVVDNAGGGIFDFLPQAGVLDEVEFETLFRTPQRTDPLFLASAQGALAMEVTRPEGFAGALATCLDGAGDARRDRVMVCRVEPTTAAEVHRRIEEAVAEAVGIVIS